MSIWAEGHKKNIGIEIRKENIKNCWFEVVIKSCEKFGSYGGKKLSSEQYKSLRYHKFYMYFKEEGINYMECFRGCIITRLGETGKDKVESYVKNVCDKYKNNIGELLLDGNGRLYKGVSDRTKEVVKEIYKLVKEENNRVLIEEV